MLLGGGRYFHCISSLLLSHKYLKIPRDPSQKGQLMSSEVPGDLSRDLGAPNLLRLRGPLSVALASHPFSTAKERRFLRDVSHTFPSCQLFWGSALHIPPQRLPGLSETGIQLNRCAPDACCIGLCHVRPRLRCGRRSPPSGGGTGRMYSFLCSHSNSRQNLRLNFSFSPLRPPRGAVGLGPSGSSAGPC